MTVPQRPDIDLAAKLFRGFANTTRLAILVELVDGERRVVDLVAGLGRSQSTVSEHLACLRECGLVEARAEGRQTFYRIASSEVVAVLKSAERLLAKVGHEIELCPNYRADGER